MINLLYILHDSLTIYCVKTCFCEWEDILLCILVLTPAQLEPTRFNPLTFARKITKNLLCLSISLFR